MQPNTQQSGVDKDALNLAHAIALQESGDKTGRPNYSAVGDAGTSKGAYQWQPGNFEATAKAHGLDPNDFSPQNQDKVAYSQIKDWKDKGYQPAEIASMWNSGSPHNWQNHSGTTTINGQQIKYDTPAYVNGVKSHFMQLSGQANQSTSGPQTTQTVTENNPDQPQEKTLGQEEIGRLKDISNTINDTVSGKINPLSGIVQGAGAIAGGLGDVVNKGLELIPGVRQVENLLGEGVGKLAQTPWGQSVSKEIANFSTAHPELSKDIGSGFNILTAIPIFKGLGAIKNVAMDATAQALKGIAERGATKDLTESISRTVGGRNILSKSPDVIKTMVDDRILPEIENGKYSVQNAHAQLGDAITHIEDNELQPVLQSVNTENVANRIPIEDLRKEALASSEKEFKSSGTVGKAKSEVNKTFDDLRNSYGDYVTLQDANDIKRGIRKSVNFNSPKLEQDVTYHIGQTMQGSIEKYAKKLGVDVGEINKRMARLIQAQKALKFIEGRPVREGLLRGSVKNIATGIGEMAGNATGIPVAGAFAGRGLGGFIEKKMGKGLLRQALERTGKNAVRVSGKQTLKKVSKMAGYNALNKIRQS